jgi:tRNA A-37 threonylcarbamoyl transferase component Bud32
MKYCDTCRSNYPNDFTTCPKDQAVLRFSSELIVGMVIRDKYQILRRIGAGGMATVYEAKHLAFNEIRALKVVSSRLAEDDAFLKRFRSEAVVTRKLQHPNAVRVDDFDTTEDGRPYIVMEYVEGMDLRHAIEKDGPFSIARTLNIGKQVASALAAAHKLGITHRDIKPDNILLISRPDGTDDVKVLDFGIAKIRDTSDMGTGYTTTKTGVVVGTPQYMSPEQAMGKSGEAIDGRSDLYSLGCALYEMLTGQLPFESETPVGLLIHHIQTTPVPPHQRAPQQKIPYALSMVLMKAMEKDKADRYQTAEEMIEALEQALHATTAMMGSAPELGARTNLMGSSEAAPAAAAAVAQKRITPKPMPSPRAPQPAAAPAPLPAARPVARPMQKKSSASTWATIVLLLIAGGGGGYWWYSQRPAPAVAPVALAKPPAITDDSIAAKIKSTMAGSSALRDVEVTVKDGVVTLGGRTAKFSDADTAIALVSGLPGVKEVHNNIANGPPVATQEPAPEIATKKEPPKKERVVVPRGSDAKTLAHVRELVASGNRQVDSGDYQTAINAFQSALVLDPNSADAESGLKRANQAKQTEEDILRRRK